MIQTYVYDWFHETKDIYEENAKKKQTIIRLFTLNEKNQSVCLSVYDFKPYFYIALPNSLKWSKSQLKLLYNYLDRHVFVNVSAEYSLKYRKQMYFANKDEHLEDVFNKYVLCTLPTNTEFFSYKFALSKSLMIDGLGPLKLRVCETNVSPILQFCCTRDLPHAGWVEFEGEEVVEKTTHCDYEYTVSSHDIFKCDTPPLTTPQPMTLSFDIEVYSSVKGQFPDATRDADCIFQVSCVFWNSEKTRNYILTLGKVDKAIVNEDEKSRILEYENEPQLLAGFIKLIHKYNPHIITGWNILGFDMHYMIQRCRMNDGSPYVKDLDHQFSSLGFIKDKTCKEIDDSWSSSAYGKQSFKYYDWNGRIILDLLMFARREIKSENYKLETIASQFIGAHKDPLTVHDIFRGYEEGVLQHKKTDTLSIVAKYCMKDSILVQRLFNEFDIWIGITEMSAVCNVPSSFLYSKGQQIKVFSQVYKYCYDHKIVFESNMYNCTLDEKCQGAYVREPIPGIYDYVIPFDFSSLYPSIMIAYNIDYSTFVLDDRIPDEACHVIEWEEEHEHDVYYCPKCGYENKGDRTESHAKWLPNTFIGPHMDCMQCDYRFKIDRNAETFKGVQARTNKIQLPSKVFTTKYRYRFLKKEKGILPTIAESLLSARKKTRATMKELSKKMSGLTDPAEIKRHKNHLNILNKRQLSYKVSCNSIYGVLGVQHGMLPLMPGAMCITAIGRKSVKLAAQHLQEVYKAHIVYGDTDSVYVRFPHISPDKLWAHARGISEKIYNQDIFPKPMKLEFEEAIYDPFFILTKKRYMWRYFKEDGSRTEEVGNKGVVLARRGTSLFLKNIYEKLVQCIFEKQTKDEILLTIIDYLNKCNSGALPVEDFIISKKVGDFEDYDESRSLPAHIRVAELMASRGEKVEVGQRLEYVVTVRGGIKAKVTLKAEDVNYYRKYASLLPIDYLYYIHLCVKQLDELLEVSCKEEQFVSKQYKLRVHKHKVLEQLKSYFRPNIIFIQ